VPYRSVLPQPAQGNNLLVPVALSCTHVGMSSLRIEGAWMVIGQGAGVAAALAAKRGVAVQDLPYPLLRERLLAQGQVLQLPPPPGTASTNAAPATPAKAPTGIVLDDTAAELAGDWTRSTNFKPHFGSGYRVAGARDARGDGKAFATFRLRVPRSGAYQLLIAYSPHETRANNVPVTIVNGSRQTKLLLDETRPLPQGQLFQPIGTVKLTADDETTLQISNTGTTGFVILDAIQLLPVE
jgi:hypothetical protein